MIRTTINPLSIIVAVDEAGGFAKDGKIPWNKPADLKHFQEVTKGGVCIMGKDTFFGIYDMVVARKRMKNFEQPIHIKEILPGRQSFVVTSTLDSVEGATTVSRLRQAVQSLQHDDAREVFVIGGYRLFIEALPWVNTVYLTVIRGTYNCDRFFPVDELANKFKIVHGKLEDDLCFLTYKRTRQ